MKIPRHVAIIMDGNGRWASDKLRPRVWGHIRGSRVVSSIVAKASELGISALTLYAFSTENWSRPTEEIQVLFKLLKKFLKLEQSNLIKNNIKFQVIGQLEGLDLSTIELIRDTEKLTQNNSGLCLSFAFGYGGRTEIIDAVNCFIEQNPGKKIEANDIAQRLYRPETGDVDLLIRTAGDCRISNFLLWQISYAELFFTNTKWPDFTASEFEAILKDTAVRERRFGSLNNQGSLLMTQALAQQTHQNFL